jgi:hypothetical protein
VFGGDGVWDWVRVGKVEGWGEGTEEFTEVRIPSSLMALLILVWVQITTPYHHPANNPRALFCRCHSRGYPHLVCQSVGRLVGQRLSDLERGNYQGTG